jgi:hypothetical protein
MFFFELALIDTATRAMAPMLIALCGQAGSNKSTREKKLAEVELYEAR